jgi:tRNA (mo5U34)-methyltransferase
MEAREVPFWYHSIELGDGVVTPGSKSLGEMQAHLAALRLPDLRGKSFLDVGAWDGFFSFEAERRGAKRVVALDPWVWNVSPVPDLDVNRLPDRKRGFDIAHEALASSVEARVADFMTIDLDELGRFDVVLFAGILYHLENPLDALRRLARVTRELAIIETAAVFVPGHEDEALWEFYEADELAGDPTNWWAPNAKALAGACRAAGFEEVELLDYPDEAELPGDVSTRYRLVAHGRTGLVRSAGAP